MIFVTVGSQMPFDRLIGTVDRWAQSRGRDDVFAQIGETNRQPAHIQWTSRLTPAAFNHRTRDAAVVVAHAGMGAILTALTLGKPIIVLPRLGALRETRNDHQVATATQLAAMGKVHAAFNEQELEALLDQADTLSASEPLPVAASPALIQTIRRFICQDVVHGIQEQDQPNCEKNHPCGASMTNE